MTAIEILLLILGFVLVGLSFLISRGDNQELDTKGNTSRELWSSKDEEMIQQRIEKAIEENIENVVEHTTDRLNHLSNEKIMAVDEFSNQILDKIEQNHKEVVFMYNMLDEKEKQLKSGKPVVATTPAKKPKPVAKAPAKKTAVTKKKEVPVSDTPVMVDASETNQKIRKLYQSGKSILEISKELDMGQGEVKLVIDLYGG